MSRVSNFISFLKRMSHLRVICQLFFSDWMFLFKLFVWFGLQICFVSIVCRFILFPRFVLFSFYFYLLLFCFYRLGRQIRLQQLLSQLEVLKELVSSNTGLLKDLEATLNQLTQLNHINRGGPATWKNFYLKRLFMFFLTSHFWTCNIQLSLWRFPFRIGRTLL